MAIYRGSGGSVESITESDVVTIAISQGGTGAQTAADARTNLGLGTAATTDASAYATADQGILADSAVQPGDIGTAAAQNVGYFATAAQGALADSSLQPEDIGVSVQAYDAQLADVAGLTATDNGVIIGNGTNFVVESGSTLRTSLGLAIGTDVLAPNGSAASLTSFPTLNQNTTGTADNVTGVVAIANGGTGQTTAVNARAALLPTYATNGGKVLAVKADASDVEYIEVAGTGTVTSVDMSVPTGLAVSGNPVTTAGTLAVTYASGYAIPTTAKQTEWDAAAQPASSNTFTANQIISVTDNSNAALRITQLGTGNALLVEDSSNPDSTPFVIDASGRVINGYTTSLSVGIGGNLGTQLTGSAGASGQTMARFDNSATGARFQFLKSRNATPGSSTIVQNGDSLGTIAWYGDDGAADYASNGGILAAFIGAEVDGTPGTNDMPGRLVFSTTADGASSPTERVRIDNAGRVIVGGSQAYVADGDTPQLQVHGTTQSTASALLANWSTTSSSEPNLMLAHSRSGTVGTHTASVSGDNLGNIIFCGSDGSAFGAGVAILAEADGTWSGSSTPAKVTFFTVPSGATGGVEAISLTSGQGLQIYRTAVTSPAAGDGNVFSGTYTPTYTAGTNNTTGTVSACQYLRVGNTVTVSGSISVTCTTAAATYSSFEMTLPIASGLTSNRQCTGTAAYVSSTVARNTYAVINCNTTTDRAEFNFACNYAGANVFYFNFTYQVI